MCQLNLPAPAVAPGFHDVGLLSVVGSFCGNCVFVGLLLVAYLRLSSSSSRWIVLCVVVLWRGRFVEPPTVLVVVLFIWRPARRPPVLLSAVRVRIFAPFFLCDVGRRHQPACAPQPLAAALWSRVNEETEPVGTGRQAAPCPAIRGVSGLRSKWAGTRTTAPARQNLHLAPHCSQLSKGLPDAARRARAAQAAAVHPVRPARLSRSVCRAAMATTEVCPAPRCLTL